MERKLVTMMMMMMRMMMMIFLEDSSAGPLLSRDLHQHRQLPNRTGMDDSECQQGGSREAAGRQQGNSCKVSVTDMFTVTFSLL